MAKASNNTVLNDLLAEYHRLEQVEKQAKRRIKMIRETLIDMSDGSDNILTSAEYSAVITTYPTERLAGKEEFFEVFGEKTLRRKGLICSGTSIKIKVSKRSKVKGKVKRVA
jgi:hypothetical protein